MDFLGTASIAVVGLERLGVRESREGEEERNEGNSLRTDAKRKWAVSNNIISGGSRR